MENRYFFSSIRLHRDDIKSLMFDPKDLDDAELEHIASKVGERSMETWWAALESVIKEYDLPSLEE